MDESIAAYVMKRVHADKHAEWHQRSIRRALQVWETEQPDWYDVLLDERAASMAVGYGTYPTSVGPNGYDTDFQFKPDLDAHLIDRNDADDLCEQFYTLWMEKLVELITEEQERSLFSPKEFATLVGYRNPRENEARVADALGISVGTYRGKVGRIQEKLDAARATLQLNDEMEANQDDWKGHDYASPLAVLVRVDEADLPVKAGRVMDLSPRDAPLDMMINEK